MKRKLTLTESELVELIQKIISEQPAKDLDELELVQLMKNGDQRAQTEFFNRFFKKMFGYVRTKSNKFDDLEIDSIVTRALGRAIDNIEQYRGESNLESWVRTIVRNSMLDLAKFKQSNKAKSFVSADPSMISQTNRYQESDPINDVKKILHDFLETLNEKEKNIMKMRADGVPTVEISKTLGVNEGTVKWYISGLMKRFKEFMKNY